MAKKKAPKKKAQHEIKERLTWDIKPMTRILPNKKGFNKNRDRKNKSYDTE